MGAKRRRIEAALKAKAALAAVRGDRTTSELAGQFGVHPTQIGQWKRQLLDGAVELFSGDQRRKVENQDALIAELYEQIGRLQMEAAWLKKIIGLVRGWVFKRRYHIGYLPAEMAKKLVLGQFWPNVAANLRMVQAREYTHVKFDLLGPAGRKKEYTTLNV